jgi:hypothetical protein
MKIKRIHIVFLMILGLVLFNSSYNRYTAWMLNNEIINVSEKYGESNPLIISINKTTTEGLFEPMYTIHLKGDYLYNGMEASNLNFSILANGSKVWATRLTDSQNNIVYGED